jgi:hypothetical protein
MGGKLGELAGKVPATVQLVLTLIAVALGGSSMYVGQGSWSWLQNNEQRFASLQLNDAQLLAEFHAVERDIASLYKTLDGVHVLLESVPPIQQELKGIHEQIAALSLRLDAKVDKETREVTIQRQDQTDRDLKEQLSQFNDHLAATDSKLEALREQMRQEYYQQQIMPYEQVPRR